MGNGFVIANGERVEAPIPCTVEEFLLRRNLPPRSVVIEHNSEAVPPSDFKNRLLRDGDRLEIVRIVAGG
jgi:thiamine biosynthesis protein ThiS